MVEFSEPIGSRFIDLADELEQILKQKVDLVSRKAIKPKYFELIEPILSMSEGEIKNLLEDIYDAVTKITSYTKGISFDDFIGDEITIDAVARNFEIIGEASK